MVSGIVGDLSQGAYSICSSGGYEDDEDNGETLIYTGEGGKNLSEGNKRTGKQTKHQELTKVL